MDLFKRNSKSVIFCNALYVWSRQFASESLWKLLKFQGVRWVTFPFAVILLWKLRKYKIQKVDNVSSVALHLSSLYFTINFFLLCREGSFSLLLDLQCKLFLSIITSWRCFFWKNYWCRRYHCLDFLWLTYGENPSCQISWNSIRIVMATIHPQKSTCLP